MEKKKRKIALIVVALLLVASSCVGVTYAIWQFILRQTDENNLTIGCFAVTFTDKNPISIGSAFPIVEAEGRELTPYEFTIENTCDSESSFQINLEVLDSTTLVNHEYIRVLLEEGEIEGTSKILISDDEVEKTLENATTSYKLGNGVLGANETKTYYLRMWLDEDTLATDNVMNKSFSSKVTIITSLGGSTGSEENGGSANYSEENITYIKSKAVEGELIEDDGTEDHNMRYVGKTPNNYVYFNCNDKANPTAETCELWRIVGVMNNVEDSEGNKSSRIKLIRNESIGEYSWDTSDNSINSGNGVNEWSQADLMKLLNPGYDDEEIGGSLYWSRSSGACYNRYSNATVNCDFTNSGLKENAKILIDEVIWYTGTTSNTYESNLGWYNVERGDFHGKNCSSQLYCNDDVERTTSWLGKVALLSMSDFGFSTSSNCLESYNTNNNKACNAKSWIFKNSNEWLITPRYDTSMAQRVRFIWNWDINGTLGGSHALAVAPSIFLTPNIKIVDGDGSSGNPFILSRD